MSNYSWCAGGVWILKGEVVVGVSYGVMAEKTGKLCQWVRKEFVFL